MTNILDALRFVPHETTHEKPAVPHHLPVLLQAFYAQVAKTHPAMSAHHRFFAAGDVADYEGGLIFCEENERVVHWGIEHQSLDSPDPPVAQWNWSANCWFADCPRLSQFLLNMLCWQLLCSAPLMGRTSYSPAVAQAVRSALQPACDSGDDYDLQGFFATNTVCCCMIPRWVFLGCNTEADLVSWQARLSTSFDLL